MNTQTATLKIFSAMCQQQVEDIKAVLDAIDDFGATALALSNSNVQGYNTFIDARDQIRELCKSTFEKYRLVVESKNETT